MIICWMLQCGTRLSPLHLFFYLAFTTALRASTITSFSADKTKQSLEQLNNLPKAGQSRNGRPQAKPGLFSWKGLGIGRPSFPSWLLNCISAPHPRDKMLEFSLSWFCCQWPDDIISGLEPGTLLQPIPQENQLSTPASFLPAFAEPSLGNELKWRREKKVIQSFGGKKSSSFPFLSFRVTNWGAVKEKSDLWG